MNVQEANNISIKLYLSGLNIFPVKEKDHYGMYRSPFRADTEPSFKVDYRQNLWYDFGSGEGGTMIDLAMKINHCTFAEAMQKLSANSGSFSFHGKQSPTESNIHIIKVLPLTNSALLDYLAERKINLDAARQQCSEIHYTVGGKAYFAIGFANDAGGYELRNKYFKGCLSPKGITTIDKGTDACLVFEGFMDYLSYLTIQKIERTENNVAILNSVANIQKAMNFLKTQKEIYTYFDNDDAGKQAVQELKSVYKNVSDQSERYKNYKDLNAFLCEKSDVKQQISKPKFKMKR